MKATNYSKHEELAEEWADNGMQLPKVGDYIFGITSGYKGDSGKYKHELSDLIQDGGNRPRLILVAHVVKVDDLFNTDYSELIKQYDIQGGCNSDDVDLSDQDKRFSLTDEERATIYTVGAVVVDNTGRWLIVDPEGYNYPRYFYSAPNYEDMFEAEIEQIQQDRAKQAEEERKQEEAQMAQHADAYEKVKQQMSVDYSYLTKMPDSTAKIRNNIVKMLKKFMPDVSFRVTANKNSYYGQPLVNIYAPRKCFEETEKRFNELWERTFGRLMPIGIKGDVKHNHYDMPSWHEYKELTSCPMMELFGSFTFYKLDIDFKDGA
jgi:hypothetical protein